MKFCINTKDVKLFWIFKNNLLFLNFQSYKLEDTVDTDKF